MHDRNGNELKLGHVVKIEFVVTGLHAESDFCNVNLESIYPMPGNGLYLNVSAVNSRQVEIEDVNAEPQPFDTKTNTWIRPPKEEA